MQTNGERLAIPNSLQVEIEYVFAPCGISLTQLPEVEADPKGREYGATRLHLNDRKVAYRIAKISPDRPGHFVTMWKRPRPGAEIIPFSTDANIEYLIVSCFAQGESGDGHRGMFIFTKDVLVTKGLMSSAGKQGKLATRIFPPWSESLAKESVSRTLASGGTPKKNQYFTSSARKTQKWQLQSFVPIDLVGGFDQDALKRLFFWR